MADSKLQHLLNNNNNFRLAFQEYLEAEKEKYLGFVVKKDEPREIYRDQGRVEMLNKFLRMVDRGQDT